MFRCATFLFAVAKVYLFLHSANFSLFFFEEQSKILGSTGKSVSTGELDNNRTYGFTLDFFSTTDWTDRTDGCGGIRQKHNKPLSSGFLTTTDRTDGTSVEDIDQKVSGGLGGVPSWFFRHRSLLKMSLGSSPMP